MATWRKWMALVGLVLAADAAAVVVSGRGTLLTDGQPALGAQVRLLRQVSIAQQELLGTTFVDGNGNYGFSFPGVTGNMYVVGVLAPYLDSSNYFLATDDTPVVRDFTMSLPGSITATVRDAATLQPLPNVTVLFYRPAGGGSGFRTDAQGQATLSGIPGGDYRICVIENADAFRNECQGNQHLPLPIDVSATTPYVLGGGENAQIVLDLDPGATIAGVVTDRFLQVPASGPLTIGLFDTAGAPIGTAAVLAASDGSYAVRGLPGGSFRLSAEGSGSNYYTQRVYPDVDCGSGCSITQGNVLAVADLQTVSAIDFSLHPGGVALGTVTENGTGAPLADVDVVAYEQILFGAWVEVTRTRTNGTGQFALTHLRPSFAKRFGSAATTHVNESWQGDICYGPPCASGTSTTFGVDQVLDGFAFTLDPGGSVRGSIVGDVSGLPLRSAVLVRNAAMTVVWSGSLDGSTPGYASYGLPPGTYYAAAQVIGGGVFICEVYSERACSSPEPIDPATATPIVITGTSVANGINFTLPEGVIQFDGFED